MHPTIIIPGSTFKNIVYAWYREGECLYVGSSSRGLARLLNHETVRRIRDTDEIKIWAMLNTGSMAQKELELILELKPKFNQKIPTEEQIKIGEKWQREVERNQFQEFMKNLDID